MVVITPKCPPTVPLRGRLTPTSLQLCTSNNHFLCQFRIGLFSLVRRSFIGLQTKLNDATKFCVGTLFIGEVLPHQEVNCLKSTVQTLGRRRFVGADDCPSSVDDGIIDCPVISD